MADEIKTIKKRLEILEERLGLYDKDRLSQIASKSADKMKKQKLINPSNKSTALAKAIRELAEKHDMYVQFNLKELEVGGLVECCNCYCECCCYA